jgi:hypothetical protein
MRIKDLSEKEEKTLNYALDDFEKKVALMERDSIDAAVLSMLIQTGVERGDLNVNAYRCGLVRYKQAQAAARDLFELDEKYHRILLDCASTILLEHAVIHREMFMGTKR